MRMALLASVLVTSLAAQPANNFLVHNLVSDLPNIADHQDASLVNAWGNGFGASPFWTGNTGTGTSTLYDGYGTKVALTVTIPAAGGATTPGPVTGVIFNSFSASNTKAFNVGSTPGSFLFCSLDGVISGWNGAAGTKAVLLADNSSSGAIYSGCTIGGNSTAPLFYAANFHSGAIDVLDMNFKPATGLATNAFMDSMIPAGYAPYNVQNLSGTLYVAYAKQDSAKKVSVAGAGNGYVAVYDTSGNLKGTLIAGAPLNAPWGMVIAPATFGPFANDLLVGNFGDGTINAFNPTTGAVVGTLNDLKGNPISIPGLWSLTVGSGARNEDPGTVYFTAGIGGGTNGAPTTTDPIQSHGLLGSIQSAPVFAAAGTVTTQTGIGPVSVKTEVDNSGSQIAGPIAPNTWIAIKGTGLSTTGATWTTSGSTLPTSLKGVSVTINGESAPLSAVGNNVLNVLVPTDVTVGTNAQIVVNNNGLASSAVSVPVILESPAFYTIGTGTAGQTYIAATHANGSLIGPTSLKGTAANGGETIVLYGTGFGTTNPPVPNGLPITQPLKLPVAPVIVVEGEVAPVSFAGLVGPGLYLFLATMPSGLPAGDAEVIAVLGNSVSPAGMFTTASGQ